MSLKKKFQNQQNSLSAHSTSTNNTKIGTTTWTTTATYPINGITPILSKKYNVISLPREDIPEEVFVCGRMLTQGLLCSDAECVYTPGKIIFKPGVLVELVINERKTIIIKYHDEIYHYKFYDKNGSSIEVITDLISIIKR